MKPRWKGSNKGHITCVYMPEASGSEKNLWYLSTEKKEMKGLTKQGGENGGG